MPSSLFYRQTALREVKHVGPGHTGVGHLGYELEGICFQTWLLALAQPKPGGGDASLRPGIPGGFWMLRDRQEGGAGLALAVWEVFL